MKKITTSKEEKDDLQARRDDHKKEHHGEWTLIDWDGNRELGYKCWRKSFGRGHVSIGVGNEFLLVCYSYGPDSGNSLSSTRWNYDSPPLSEEEVMRAVDRNGGKHGPLGQVKPSDWDERHPASK